LATKIQLRRDVEAQWIANNPTLSSGEVGIATDKNKFKVGNGSDAWNSLEYLDSREAEKLQVERVIQLSGDVSGSVTFDGSASVNISTEIQPDSVSLGTDTTGDYVSSISASGDGLFVTGSGESASVTIENTGVTSLYGTSNQVDVSSSAGSVTISLPETIHRNLQGNVTGNSDTASSLQNAKTIALGGDLSGSVSFDGSSSVTINATVQPDSVSLGTDTTGSYVAQVTGSGNGILVTGSGESASVSIENTGVHSLTGTANEVNVSASSGSITVGLPSNVTIQSELNVLGNLTVSGSTTTINTQTLIVEDKNIEIGNVDDPTDITANGGGITLKGATDKTFNWIDATDSWTSSEHIDLANGKVVKHNGTEILSSTEYVGNSATSTKLATARSIALSGDVTGSANFDGSSSAGISATLANSGVSANSYGSASAVGTFTVDSKGRLTAASNTAIAIAQSAVTNLTTDLGLKANLASPALSGTPTAPTAAIDTNTTQVATTAFVLAQASGANPLALGSVAQGTSNRYSRQDHVHPTTGLGLTSGKLSQFAATTSAELAGVISDETGSGELVFANSPTLTTPNIGVATGTSFNSITGLSSTNPTMNGAVAVGTGTTVARADHVHPVDTSRAPLNSPTFTGTLTTPTLSLTTSDTATAATHYMVETGSDGIVRPKTLANVRTEVVTNAAVNSAAATTVGTITSGTWAATDVGLAHGGTNASLTASNGAVVYSTASALALTSVGNAGEVLTSNGSGAPTWQAASGGGGFETAMFLGGM
jgi:hypothetical protein